MSPQTHCTTQNKKNKNQYDIKNYDSTVIKKCVSSVKYDGGDGLVNAAITDRQNLWKREPFFQLEIYPNGARGKRTIKKKGCFISTNPRGEIYGFSRKSQKRMMNKMMMIDFERYAANHSGCKHSQAFFCTLTYPQTFSDNHEDYKRDLQTFRKRLFREYKIKAVVWKLEYQKRNAPHYHLLIFFHRMENISKFRHWASGAWYEVVGSGDYKHLSAGVNTEVVHKGNGVSKLFGYLGKYISKVQKTEFATGRVWGVWGDLPTSLPIILRLTRHTLVKLLRTIRRWGDWSNYLSKLTMRWVGFSLYIEKNKLLQLVKSILPEC